MILQPYHTLISLKMPSYERYGSLFAAPILSLFGKQTEIAIIPELWNSVLKTLIQLIQIYPVYMANYFNDANHSQLLEIIYDLFAKQVKLITVTRLGGERESTLTSRGGSKAQGQQPQASKKKKNNADDEDESTSGPNETDIYQLYLQGKRKFSFNEEIEAENDCFAVLVFQLVEQLLLSCSSSSLTPIFSYVMNQGIYSMLICLEKGLLTPSMTDKRLLSMKNRFNEGILPERIRYSAVLQESVLSLTLANILTFHYFNIDEGTLQGIIHTQKEQQQHGNTSSMNKKNSAKTIAATTTTTTAASHHGPSNAEYLHARYLHLNCYSMNLHKFHILCNMICHSRSAPISLHNVAMQGILTVSTMIHPISLPLPVLPVKDVMKYYDQEWKRRVETTESAVSGEQMNKEDNEAEEVSKKEKKSKKRAHVEDQVTAPEQGKIDVEASNEVTDERPQEKKRKSNEESAKKKPTKSSAVTTATQSPAAFSFSSVGKEVVDKKKKNDKKQMEKKKVEDEDDELPDLDM
jgi:hypothetical protein